MPLPLALGIGAGVQAIGSLAQGLFGSTQYKRGKKMLAGLERPTYEIPSEIKQNLTQAQLQALEGLPAEQKQSFVENIQRAMTSGQQALTERGLGVAGASGLVQQQIDAYKGLMGQDVAARQANLENLASARGTMASFKERAFDINQMQPFLQQQEQAQQMMGAGQQNIGGAISGGLGNIGSMFSNYMMYNQGNGSGRLDRKTERDFRGLPNKLYEYGPLPEQQSIF
jgi:hypothetical protein